MISVSLFLLFLPVGFSASLVGWVQSPGYPHGYSPQSALEWKRCAPEGHTLTLTFIHLDLEDSQDCENDAVRIFVDDIPHSTLCGRMSTAELRSSVNPSLYSPPKGCISLKFSADYSNTKRHTGFRAFYTIQDVDECTDPANECSHLCNNFIGGYRCTCPPGYLLNSDKHTCTVQCDEDLSGFREGAVRPPGILGSYASDARCNFTLSVDEGLQLLLTFNKDFDIEKGEDGNCIDSVTIETPSGSYGPFCGKVPPEPIRTGTAKAQILFSSDGGGSNKGFTLSYKVTAMTCFGKVTPHSRLTPQLPEYPYGSTVTVQCDVGYFASVVDTKSDVPNEFKSTCQKNGEWSPVHQCTPVDCGNPEADLPEVVRLKNPTRNTLYQGKIQLECESKYYKLVGYDSFTCNANGAWVSENGKEEWPRCVPVCGVTDTQGTGAGRITGGQKAHLGSIPWQLLKKNPRGGAALISDRWVITAAHVVDGQENSVVSLMGGMVDGQDKNAITMESEKIIIHPKYHKVGRAGEDPPSYDNDIALIKLSDRVKLGPNLLPVCLPTNKDGRAMEGKDGTISGFGAVKENRLSRYLLYGNVQEKSKDICEKSRVGKLPFTQNMFCAGGDKGVDSCKGDSGGPLVVPVLGFGNPDRPYQLRGIVSWGQNRCGSGGFIGFYTKVQNYLDWIKEVMEAN
ncbi:complement C1s subcomponent [Chanos chanos]|uniref:Complement C1s subcomponent n=1 Tax=Chanos chanos TaxID=29144 RepID=A0A6J2W6F8_CHACN|nr:complement C1s subcomponent-like [Chanos chanos]